MRSLTSSQARRIALAAQGFADPRPGGKIDIRHLRRVLDRVALLQIDSVNVVARSHYLPLFSRLGPYPPALLDDAAYRRHELFEYWAHEACLIPVAHQPLMRDRMARMEPGRRTERLLADEPDYIDKVLAEIVERGPLSVSDISDPGERAGPWWGWSRGKVALEWLFATGRVTTSGRRNFARVYDLPERVLPADVLAAPTPDRAGSYRGLLLVAARAHGVATAADLADYHRLHRPTARAFLTDLVADGSLAQVRVDGWREPGYLHPEARMPRRVDTRALLSPFDSLVWERARVERLFGFRYRIEIYVPAPQRVYGYYVLPFLLGERLVARVDLKADRAARRLLVRAAWGEQDVEPAGTAPALAAELRDMAAWLELDDVLVHDHGDLARPLAWALTATA